jgi:hypothetical protein
MTVLTDQILITVWWTIGKKWFRARDISEVMKANVAGIGSSLRTLQLQGLLETKEVEAREPRKSAPNKLERKRVRHYRLGREGLKVVRRLIGVSEADGKDSKKDPKGS